MKRSLISLFIVYFLLGCRLATPYVTYSRLSPDQYGLVYFRIKYYHSNQESPVEDYFLQPMLDGCQKKNNDVAPDRLNWSGSRLELDFEHEKLEVRSGTNLLKFDRDGSLNIQSLFALADCFSYKDFPRFYKVLKIGLKVNVERGKIKYLGDIILREELTDSPSDGWHYGTRGGSYLITYNGSVTQECETRDVLSENAVQKLIGTFYGDLFSDFLIQKEINPCPSR